MNVKERFVNWLIGTPDSFGYNGTFQTPTNYYDDASASKVAVATTCVKILSETVGKMPIGVWKTDSTKGKVKDKGHYLYNILHRQPNNYTTANTFFQTSENHRNYKGNSFARIHRHSGTGRVQWLETIPPSKVKNYSIKGNDLYYTLLDNDDKEYVLNQSEILHFRMMSPDGVWGINPISALSLNMGITHKGMQSLDSFYKNNALSPKALKTIVGSSNAAKSKEALAEFNAANSGVMNAGKWINLPPNTDIVDLQINLADAQIIESLKFNSQQIAALYGVPVYMATGDFTQSKFNNIEQSQLSFKVNTISSITRMYKAELESKLLTEKDRKAGIEIEFNLNSLVEPDTKTKVEYYRGLANIGAITPHQIAVLESLPADPVQNLYLAQTNLQELSKFKREPLKEANSGDKLTRPDKSIDKAEKRKGNVK